ncbi:MAG: DUF2357 domain-containing protein [Firmicutes bacterium]|nr:DUF2357 domain-containing protein [Bacillota bacterium]
MKKTSDLVKFHQQLNDAFYELEKEDEFPNHFYTAFLSGENTLFQKTVSETKTFHEEWMGTIESYFPSLDKITKDPKSGLKYLQEVVAIEKAKKTNSDSIRHLAANTHLIKEIRNGQVIPKKILTTQAEIEYAIYENRFIKTLVNRLFDFVNNRHELVKNNVESFQTKQFKLTSTFDIRETKVDLDIDMKFIEDLENDEVGHYNHELLNRIQNLLKKVNGIRVSPFMEELKNAKPVIPPIMKTSILLKNIDYQNCYNLWLYLDKYNTLNYDVNVTEKNLTFDRYYLRNVYQSALTAFTTVYANQKALEDHYQYLDVSEYKKKSPKFLKKSLSDIMKNPDPFILEDTQMNQYFLDQNKKAFDEKLEKFRDESSSYDVALRKALRDTIAITNTLFQDYFDLNDDDDADDIFFSRMVKQDLDAELLKAKDKARIARIIRETKEVDYNNSIRLEKRMLKEIERINKEISKGLKKRAIDEAKKQAIEERIKLERVNLDKNQETLSGYLEFVSEQKRIITDEARDINERIKAEEKRIKAEEKKIIELEKKKATIQYNAEIRKLKTKQRLEKEKYEKLAKAKIRAEKKRYKEEQLKLEKASKERIQKEKQKARVQAELKIKKVKKEKSSPEE